MRLTPAKLTLFKAFDCFRFTLLLVTLISSVLLGGCGTGGSFQPNSQSNSQANSQVAQLAFEAIPTKYFATTPFNVKADSLSPGAITYSVTSGPATISGSLVTPTGVGNVVLLATQAAAGSYAGQTASTAFNVMPGVATLAIGPITTKVFGDAPFTVGAISNSTGSITYAVLTGPASVDHGSSVAARSGEYGVATVSLTGAGTVTLSASQAADANYAAQTAQVTFTVNPGIPALSFAAVSPKTFGTAPFPVAASSTSTGAITYTVSSGPATIAGNTVTLTGAGTVTLSATQAANANYAAQTAQVSFTVTPETPALTFAAIPPKSFGTAPFMVAAASASTGAITYTVNSGPATIAGNTVTITGAGTVTLSATQAADANYAAQTAQVSFAVSPEIPALAFVSIAPENFGTAPFPVTATSASTGAITYGVSSGPATIVGNMITLTGAGTVTVAANQAATANYAAQTAQASFTVSPISPVLSIQPVPPQNLGAAPFPVTVTSSSAGAITLSVVSGPATINGTTVTITGAGTVELGASQVAYSGYSADSTTTSFTVAATPAGISYVAAARFLAQATWGPTEDSIAQVQKLGYSAYIDSQLSMPADTLVVDANFLDTYQAVWMNALTKPSQLRQKTMWTWFKLFNPPGSTTQAWMSAFPELLLRDAFVPYDKLLYDASMNTEAAMALNLCCDNDAGPSPNENYSREIMQLFTMGPVQLNLDGTPKLDGNGATLPQYSEQDVSEGARALTGWKQSPSMNTDTEGLTTIVPGWSGSHDYGQKSILGATLPAGSDWNTDMVAVVHLLTTQTNTAPFLSLKLIRALVTSNPSPAYVARISQVWLNDGTGVTGNIGAVLKAVLLDPEARAGDDPTVSLDPIEGRAMDVIEWQSRVGRLLNVYAPGMTGLAWTSAIDMGESALSAPSVFGYYRSSYTLPGTTTLAPELSLYTTPALQDKASYLQNIVYRPPTGNDYVDYSSWTQLATGDGTPLIDHINNVCLHGRMSAGLRALLLQAFAEVPADSHDSQAKRLLYLTFMSPEFSIVR